MPVTACPTLPSASHAVTRALPVSTVSDSKVTTTVTLVRPVRAVLSAVCPRRHRTG